MKFKIFDEITLPKTTGGAKSNIPRVAFGKAGTLTFNQAACRLMGLKETDHVGVVQDEAEPDNWYFFKDNKAGFALRLAYSKKGCIFNHIGLVKMILAHFDLSADISHNFLIAGKPTLIKGDVNEYFGIIVLKRK